MKHESNYEYSLRKTNSDGSKDHGIFQLNSNYWCDMPEGYNGTTCWRLDTFGCQYTCSCRFEFKCLFSLLASIAFKNVQGGNDQEKAQSEKNSHSKNRGDKKLN